jgi:HAD superfamily hydrolase (TIGR01509 family)
MLKNKHKIKAVLFDLDGTLADTSPDMCASLNRVLVSHKLKTVDCVDLKKHISRGALGVIEYASHVNGRDIDSSLLRSEFLDDYKDHPFVKTKLNKDMDELINYLINKSIIIGIVTNKHSRYVKKIIEGLDLTEKLSCVITGDMVLNTKPAIDGLVKAAEEIQCNVDEIIYVGDDERDIIAGRDAGMNTIAADFGFISADINVKSWNSDLIIYDALELKNYI